MTTENVLFVLFVTGLILTVFACFYLRSCLMQKQKELMRANENQRQTAQELKTQQEEILQLQSEQGRLAEKEENWTLERQRLVDEKKNVSCHLESALNERNSSQEQLSACRATIEQLSQAVSKSEETKSTLEAAVCKNLAEIKRLDLENQSLRVTRSEREESYKAQLQTLKDAKADMEQGFENLANKILTENSESLAKKNNQQIGLVLAPYHQELTKLHRRVNEVHTENIKGRAALGNELKNLSSINMQMSKDAKDLTKAMRGDTKQQGCWGEVVLERLLESTGMRKGDNYRVEVYGKTEEGNIVRPDVVVDLPGNRNVVIDSKVSLNSFYEYQKCDDKEAGTKHLKMHATAVKKHVATLSQKNYESLIGVNSLDFVFMFMPNDMMHLAACQFIPELQEEAFRKGVILTSPNTLLAALRLVHSLWRNERQNQHAMKIASEAGKLHDKFVDLVHKLEKVSGNMERAQNGLAEAKRALTTGHGNLVGKVEKIKQMGVPTKKSLPSAWASEEHHNG